MVEPDHDVANNPFCAAVIHLNTMLCCAHLIEVYGSDIVPKDLFFTNFLDAFHLFYVNKFIDNYAF